MRKLSFVVSLALSALLVYLALQARVPLPMPLSSGSGARVESGDRLRRHVSVEERAAVRAVEPVEPAPVEPIVQPVAVPTAPAETERDREPVGAPEVEPVATEPIAADLAPVVEPVPEPVTAPADDPVERTTSPPDERVSVPPVERPIAAPVEAPPAGAAPRSRPDPMVAELERLLAEVDSSAPPPRSEPVEGDADETDSLLRDLEALVAAANADAPRPPTRPGAPPASTTASTTAPPTASSSASKPPSAASEQSARARVREQLEAVFRLEPQDPVHFREVCRRHGMDALLTHPPAGSHSIIPATGTFYDRVEHEPGGPGLDEKYGLIIQGLQIDWLERYREQYVATHLVPGDAVEAHVLVPHAVAERILERIIADCTAGGVDLERVRECFGTFVAEPGGARGFEYRVTRIVLEDGTVVGGVGEPGRGSR